MQDVSASPHLITVPRMFRTPSLAVPSFCLCRELKAIDCYSELLLVLLF
jgi:hypothetical protein